MFGWIFQLPKECFILNLQIFSLILRNRTQLIIFTLFTLKKPDVTKLIQKTYRIGRVKKT